MPPVPLSKKAKSTAINSSQILSRKKRVKSGASRPFFVRFFFRIDFVCRDGIFSRHKMLAEIRAILFFDQIFDTFAAIKMTSRRIKFASFTAMQIRATFRANRIPINALRQIDFFAAFPTHIFIVNI